LKKGKKAKTNLFFFFFFSFFFYDEWHAKIRLDKVG